MKSFRQKMYQRECAEHNKTAFRCYGNYYVSGNKARESGYEECAKRDRCPWYLYRDEAEIRDTPNVAFSCVSDFRKCNKVTKL
jgi:hypothetical protein